VCPSESTLAADPVDLWNSAFFLVRGVEVVLYKGRERRSGPNAGSSIDSFLPTITTHTLIYPQVTRQILMLVGIQTMAGQTWRLWPANMAVRRLAYWADG